MRNELCRVAGIPAVIYGEPSERAYLFVHGKCGCKEEAEDFAACAVGFGWQVMGVDLPGHGERQGEAERFTPWDVTPELKAVMREMRQRWPRVALRANSIGAWFSLLSFADEPLAHCLFVSPLLDMRRCIDGMMRQAGVTAAELRQKKEIETAFGETLSWRYREFVRRNPVEHWDAPTSILYAGRDDITDRATVEDFAARFRCRLTVMEDGEHWFHTPEQMDVLHSWTEHEMTCRWGRP